MRYSGCRLPQTRHTTDFTAIRGSATASASAPDGPSPWIGVNGHLRRYTRQHLDNSQALGFHDHPVQFRILVVRTDHKASSVCSDPLVFGPDQRDCRLAGGSAALAYVISRGLAHAEAGTRRCDPLIVLAGFDLVAYVVLATSQDKIRSRVPFPLPAWEPSATKLAGLTKLGGGILGGLSRRLCPVKLNSLRTSGRAFKRRR